MLEEIASWLIDVLWTSRSIAWRVVAVLIFVGTAWFFLNGGYL